jgi:tetratricopeptide (TPR) repeat protein
VTLALANVALTAEDFDGALGFYEKTLALSSNHHDAMFGRLRALSYLDRHEDAIAAADAMLESHWYGGDALYWRAWNDLQLERTDQAWADIQSASELLITADVAKLAGIIAYQRHELDVSRAKFEAGRRMNDGDCEIGFYLGLVNAELRLWQPTVDVFVATAICLEESRRQLTQEIATLKASSAPEDRKAKKIARRERQLVVDTRRLATSWFNAAVGAFNLSHKTQAREYAEKVRDDEQYGERARELLSRLEK